MARVPSYRRQKRKTGDLGFVELDGKRTYLGAYGTEASRRRYAAVLAEWTTCGASPRRAPTVIDVVDAWVSYTERQEGRGAAIDLANSKTALRMLCKTYGTLPASRFGCVALESLRNKMVTDTSWTRQYIGKQTARIRRLFKWAARRELVPPTVPASLAMLTGLRAGNTSAPESDPVGPVSDEAVDATLKYLSPTVAGMIETIRLTGARPGEICRMRSTDLDRSGKTWTYSPRVHKSAWRNKKRVIHLGPRAQAVLEPFLSASVGGFVFSPRRAEEARRDAVHAARKTPMSCGNRPGSRRKRKPRRQPGECYTAMSLAHAVSKACLRAFPAPKKLKGDALEAWRRDHHWSPGQLRHSAGTRIRAQYGVEAAGAILGHTRLSATEIYAEVDEARAAAIVAEVG